MNKPAKTALASGLVLFLAIAAVGLYRWQNAQPVDAEESETMAVQSELNTQVMQDTLTEQLTAQPMGEAQERMDSPTGQAMFRACIEWTEFNENHPSEMARANETKACGEYRNYVDNGVLPE